MTLPANFGSVYVRGRYIDLSGAPIRGSVTFEPQFKDVLIDLEPRIIIGKKTFTATTDVNGQFTILLPATDDPDILPVEWTYRVTEPTGRVYNIVVPLGTLPLSSSGDPLDGQKVIDLAQVVPAGNPSGGTVQLVASIGPQGPQGVQGVQGPAGEVTTATLTAHTGNTSNPHATTKAQVGLGNADNTSDANKPVSTAQQTALDLKAAKSANLSDLANAATARTNLGLVVPQGVRVYANATAQSIASGAYPTYLDLNTTEFNENTGLFTVDLTNDRITVLAGGLYMVSWDVSFANSTALREAYVTKNGGGALLAAAAGTGGQAGRTAPIRLVTNDYLQVIAYVEGGVAVSLITNAPHRCGLGLYRIGL